MSFLANIFIDISINIYIEMLNIMDVETGIVASSTTVQAVETEIKNLFSIGFTDKRFVAKDTVKKLPCTLCTTCVKKYPINLLHSRYSMRDSSSGETFETSDNSTVPYPVEVFKDPERDVIVCSERI